MTVVSAEEIQLREPSSIMQPERVGSMQPTELSFSRSLIRKMLREKWQVKRVVWELDERARGDALYTIETGGLPLHFIVFSMEPIIDEFRTGRIIGRRWDMFGALIEGELSPTHVEQTRAEWEKLYAGRAPAGTLIWCRSNRSGRVFDHVVESLADGTQPNIEILAETGYIMRNTGLDGNGTFGTKSYLAYGPGHPLRTPYHAQMLCAYLMREFAADLVEHLAQARSSDAVELDPALKRYIGVGNGSALGLGFWVINHPHWVNRWIELRERALAIVRKKELTPDHSDLGRFLELLDRCVTYRAEDMTDYEYLTTSKQVAAELAEVRPLIAEFQGSGRINGAPTTRPWDALVEALPAGISIETQETVVALLIDIYPELADEFEPELRVAEVFELEPTMTAGELLDILGRDYRWAQEIDLTRPDAYKFTWYKSEEAEEPRRGPRNEVEGGYELAIDFAGEVQFLTRELSSIDPRTSVGEFLLLHPGHRSFIERVQSLRELRYHTPHMNMFDANFVPVYLTRLANVPFFGLDKTRDFGNRVLAGVIHQGAPTRDDLANGWSSEWRYPIMPRQKVER